MTTGGARGNDGLRGGGSGRPLMHQSWGDLLFLHWKIAPDVLRPLVPAGLDLDLYDGDAWVSVTPFLLYGMRLSFLPPLPGVSRFPEVNVRTYVRGGGEPGIWFFSLDAGDALAAAGARVAYRLPYHAADATITTSNGRTRFHAVRRSSRHPARIDVAWTEGTALPEARPGSLEDFLVERYCLYAAHRDRLYRGRISHRPWPLREARLDELATNLPQAAGIHGLAAEPFALQAGGPVDVDVWPLERVAD